MLASRAPLHLDLTADVGSVAEKDERALARLRLEHDARQFLNVGSLVLHRSHDRCGGSVEYPAWGVPMYGNDPGYGV